MIVYKHESSPGFVSEYYYFSDCSPSVSQLYLFIYVLYISTLLKNLILYK